MQVIGYIRVSTNEQATEGLSLTNQIEKIKTYCNLNDLQLMKVISDAGKSGKNLNREGLQELLEDIKHSDIKGVIVYKLDRLSRKVLDTLSLIEKFESSKVAFHSVTEKINTSSATGRFLLNITASHIQLERDLISERTKDVLQMKIKNNERAGQIPYGWQLDQTSNKLIENTKEQETIKIIKKLNNKNISLRKICYELETLKINPNGKKWYPQTIKNILNKRNIFTT